MRHFLINLLGGVTKSESAKKAIEAKDELHKNYISKIKELHRKSFRSGDVVYISKKCPFNFGDMYYLLEPYNNGFYWYISKYPDDKQRRELSNGISVECISKERPERCECCNQFLTDEQK